MIPTSDDQARRSFPIITILLILANVLVFVGWQLRTGVAPSIAKVGFLPGEFTSNPISIWTWSYIFTSMFFHAGWMPLLANMFFLGAYGGSIEDSCGSTRFFFLYLLCGVADILVFTLINPHGDVPIVGASGAVSGVIGAYCLDFGAELRRDYRDRDLFRRPFERPAFTIVSSAWFGVQFLALRLEIPDLTKSIGSIAFAFAPLVSAFLVGFILIVFFKQWRRE